MALNIAMNNAYTGQLLVVFVMGVRWLTAKCPDKIVYHPGSRSTNGVGHTNTVHSCGIDGLVKSKKVDQVALLRALAKSSSKGAEHPTKGQAQSV